MALKIETANKAMLESAIALKIGSTTRAINNAANPMIKELLLKDKQDLEKMLHSITEIK